VSNHRLQSLAVNGIRFIGNAEHCRLARAVNVGIQQTDFGAFLLKRERQVSGYRAFAYAAFAAGNGNDVADGIKNLNAPLNFVSDNVLTDFDIGRDARFDQFGTDHLFNDGALSFGRII